MSHRDHQLDEDTQRALAVIFRDLYDLPEVAMPPLAPWPPAGSTLIFDRLYEEYDPSRSGATGQPGARELILTFMDKLASGRRTEPQDPKYSAWLKSHGEAILSGYEIRHHIAAIVHETISYHSAAVTAAVKNRRPEPPSAITSAINPDLIEVFWRCGYAKRQIAEYFDRYFQEFVHYVHNPGQDRGQVLNFMAQQWPGVPASEHARYLRNTIQPALISYIEDAKVTD